MTPIFQQQSVSFFFTILNNTLVQKKHPITRGYPFVTRHRPPPGHMSQSGSHVTKWATCLKVGHPDSWVKSHKGGSRRKLGHIPLVGHQPQHSNSTPLNCARVSKPSRFLVLVFNQTHHTSLNFTRRIPPPPCSASARQCSRCKPAKDNICLQDHIHSEQLHVHR